MDYPVVLQGVLNRIQETVKVDIEDYDGEEEWFEIESEILEDFDLYNQLRLHWRRIAGIHSSCFALLYWPGGPYEGVWLHYLATLHKQSEYLPGCHLVT